MHVQGHTTTDVAPDLIRLCGFMDLNLLASLGRQCGVNHFSAGWCAVISYICLLERKHKTHQSNISLKSIPRLYLYIVPI